MLEGRKILVGISGGIAAYKIAFLVRLLKKENAEVQVLLTQSAKHFISPLTLSVLSDNPVLSEFHEELTGEWNNHVRLGMWADLYLIGPATANTLGSMAHGLCHNLLLATYFSAKCPVMIAPAMDLDMYAHPTTTENIERLRKMGVNVIDAEVGYLASGLEGKGRMAEPETILRQIQAQLKVNLRFEGKKVVITAGPTYEPLDPVRFIGNHSTGKMGYALAETFAQQGASVTLISGPTQLKCAQKNVRTIAVQRSQEMYDATERVHGSADIVIFSAAVSDYAPEEMSPQKIKKTEGHFHLNLVKTVDIAKELGKRKTGQLHVGFALETDNEQVNAEKKLQSKNFDIIVLNSLNDSGAGFGHDTNKVTIIEKDGKAHQFKTKSKKEVANDIADIVAEKLGL